MARLRRPLAASADDRGRDQSRQTTEGSRNTRHVTADGLERTFALNHLAPFLLTNLLLARPKHSAPVRVVTVSSNVSPADLRRSWFSGLIVGVRTEWLIWVQSVSLTIGEPSAPIRQGGSVQIATNWSQINAPVFSLRP